MGWDIKPFDDAVWGANCKAFNRWCTGGGDSAAAARDHRRVGRTLAAVH